MPTRLVHRKFWWNTVPRRRRRDFSDSMIENRKLTNLVEFDILQPKILHWKTLTTGLIADLELVLGMGAHSDADGEHRATEGAVFVIVGTGGRERPVDRLDRELGYFAAVMGEGDSDWGHGVLRLDISDTSLTGTFVGSDTAYSDSFTMRR